MPAGVRVLFTTESPGDLVDAWRAHHLESAVVPRTDVAWRRIDLYLNADPWNAQRTSGTLSTGGNLRT